MIIYECDRCREQQQHPLTRVYSAYSGQMTELCDICMRMFLPPRPTPQTPRLHPPDPSNQAQEELHFTPEPDARTKAQSPHNQRIPGNPRKRGSSKSTPPLTGIAPEDRENKEP